MSIAATASSSTLWAQPSKEWIIQPKPKPGRKPKKDLQPTPTTILAPAASSQQIASPSSLDDTLTDSKGRRVQNRAAQRAFRERKQSQLAELQARLQSFEQGEIERTVALQNIAKRFKEENEALKKENAGLKETLARVEQERDALKAQNAQMQQPAPAKKRSRPAEEIPASPPRKKTRAKVEERTPTPDISSPPSPLSSASSDSLDSPYFVEMDDPPSMLELSPPKHSLRPAMFNSFDCGFCVDDSSCVCRQVALQQAAENMTLKMEAIHEQQAVKEQSRSILENLPAFQPAVPLRRKPRSKQSQISPVFQVTPLSTPSNTIARRIKDPAGTCSGDPSNCSACADDSFGKAFCEALNSTGSCSTSGCKSCDGKQQQQPDDAEPETIPTNAAWKQLKTHPNVSFADLSLLADVVARRSKCTGPDVVIEPAPGTFTPERGMTPANAGDADVPMLVPHEELLRCGRQRTLREVNAAGVKDALRLLDARFTL